MQLKLNEILLVFRLQLKKPIRIADNSFSKFIKAVNLFVPILLSMKSDDRFSCDILTQCVGVMNTKYLLLVSKKYGPINNVTVNNVAFMY